MKILKTLYHGHFFISLHLSLIIFLIVEVNLRIHLSYSLGSVHMEDVGGELLESCYRFVMFRSLRNFKYFRASILGFLRRPSCHMLLPPSLLNPSLDSKLAFSFLPSCFYLWGREKEIILK